MIVAKGILILCVTEPNFRYKCDRRGVHAHELDDAWGGICLKFSSVGAFTWSSLRWCQSVVVQRQKQSSCAVWYLSGGLRRVWSSRLLACLYFAVKSWNFVGLICLLFAGRG